MSSSGGRLWLPKAGFAGGQAGSKGRVVPVSRPVRPEGLGPDKPGQAGEPAKGLGEGGGSGSGAGQPGRLIGLGGAAPKASPSFQLLGANGLPLQGPSRSPGPTGEAPPGGLLLGANGQPAERSPYVTAQDVQAYKEHQKSRKKSPPYRRLTLLSPYSRGLAFMFEELEAKAQGSELAVLAASEALVMKPVVEAGNA